MVTNRRTKHFRLPTTAAAKRATQQSTESDSEKLSPSTIGTVMAVAGTLVVGVLASLGVAGNLLARMVRNDPVRSAQAMALVIVLVSALLITFLLGRKLPPWAPAIPVLGLTAALVLTAWLGARSQGTREIPSVSLSVTKSESGALTLTAKASSTSLHSDDKMLLRIVGLTKDFSADEELVAVVDSECRRGSLIRLDPRKSHLMAWTETAPNASGEAAVEQQIPLPSTLRYACAYAILGQRSRRLIPDDPAFRSNYALVDLAFVASSTVPLPPTH